MKDLYYVLMYNYIGNAKQCKTYVRHGDIKVNGETIYDPLYKVQYHDHLVFRNKQLYAQPFLYYMLNKPQGYICANKDRKEKCVIDIIKNKECFCLGRLDRDTTGLLILTNDKNMKKLLLPQNHVEKVYYVEVKNKLSMNDVQLFHRGVIIDKTRQCLPAKLKIIDDYHCQVTIEEGKYHQIKKMFLSIHNEVLSLKRIQFGQLILDQDLQPGEYRLLSFEEIELLNNIK